MSTPQFFADRLAAELPAFNRVIRALPAEKLDYQPHEKNKAAGDLAWQLVTEMAGLVDLFNTGDINYVASPHPSGSEIVENFEQNGQKALDAAQAVSEERWNSPGRFLWAGQVAWEDKVSEIAWGFLLDMIHHRGQLSVYIRPMGGRVPAIYGPSGDDAGQ